MLDDAQLSMGHAKVLLGLAQDEQPRWADAALRGKWSVRKFEQCLQAAPKASARDAKSADTERLARQLADYLGTPVQIHHTQHGGEIRLKYFDLDGLDALLQRMGYPTQ